MRLTNNRAIAKNTKFPHRILLSFGTWSDFRRIGNNSSQSGYVPIERGKRFAVETTKILKIGRTSEVQTPHNRPLHTQNCKRIKTNRYERLNYI